MRAAVFLILLAVHCHAYASFTPVLIQVIGNAGQVLTSGPTQEDACSCTPTNGPTPCTRIPNNNRYVVIDGGNHPVFTDTGTWCLQRSEQDNHLLNEFGFKVVGGKTCPPGSTPSGGTCTCTPTFLQTAGACNGGKNNGGGGCKPNVGNPCNAGTGNKWQEAHIYTGLNGFRMTLSFNSQDNDNTGRFGRRRHDSFDRRIVVIGTNAVSYRPDGKAVQFVPSGDAWVASADTTDRLSELKDAAGARTGWTLQLAEGDETEIYDASGRVLTIRSRSGLVQSMAYSDGTVGPSGGRVLDASGQPTAIPLPAGLLVRAADNVGRTIAFGYDFSSRVTRMTDPAAGLYRFGYDAVSNLVTIGFPDAGVLTYVYNESANTGGAALTSALTGITDENGARFATFKYDAQERVVSTEHASGAERYTLSYGSNGTTVTDPLGTIRTYLFQTILTVAKTTGFSGPPCPQCGPQVQTYDANGNVASRTDWNGNRIDYTYDLARNLETSRTEGLSATGGATPQTRTISTVWHPLLRLPRAVVEPLRITTYVYNGDGNVRCGFEADGTTLVRGVLCAKTVEPTSDATGVQGFGATASGPARTWNYTYNLNGSVLTVDGPRTDVADVTTYTYYPNDDPDTGKRGNVATITNALGHVSSITAYNAHGQATSIFDPNGMLTILGYDARQRLTSRSVGGETTRYDYDLAGQLTKVTLPDGSFLSHAYDAAHRLIGVSDIQGNRIAYTLDAMGNRTKEEVFDPVNVLAQTRGRVFDSLSRLAKDIGAQNQTTQYDYDGQGNIISVVDPLAQVTFNQYDGLNRLAQVIDPGSGVTRYAYNGIDQLTSVTDPRSLTTRYSYDGLGNLNQQVSPDTGTTRNTHDTAGNLQSQIDAKGQTTTYTYDALNRVTDIVFQDGSRQAYVYDAGANALGRLTQIVERDANAFLIGQTSYAYDVHGRVTAETRAIAGVMYRTAYQYDVSGRMTGMTYPSGREVTFSLDSLGRIREVSSAAPNGTPQAVATGVDYQPFGGVRSYTAGNGRVVMRGHDLDGRIASYSLGPQSFAVGYDAASRIRFLADAANAANANTYGYDAVDRITSAIIPNNQYAYSYDAVGNRISKTVGSSSEIYTYDATSNRVAGITTQAGASRLFAFDVNGSTLNDAVNKYVYDARGRMVQSIGPLGMTAYYVNALGQRVRKTNGTDDRVFHYDAKGRLIAESDPAGGVLREYIYLNDIPVAVVQ